MLFAIHEMSSFEGEVEADRSPPPVRPATLGPELWRGLLQERDQTVTACRSRDFVAPDDLRSRYLVAVEFAVGAVIGTQRRAFEGSARKNASRSRVTQDLRTQVGISVRGEIATHRSRGDG